MSGILDALGIVHVPGGGGLADARAELLDALPILPDIDGMLARDWADGPAGEAWIETERAALGVIVADDLADWIEASEPRMLAFHQYRPRRAVALEKIVRAAMNRLLLD